MACKLRPGTDVNRKMEPVMGKYVLAWLLGVPVFVLVIVYILFH
jgi:hypothetical protein